MSSEYQITETLDVTGQSCPMPIVKTKQAIDDLEGGDVLEIVATDSGSMRDVRGWAKGTDGVELLEQVEEDDRYTHYVKKTEYMSTDNSTTPADAADPDVDAAELQALRERVEELEASMAAVDSGDDQKKMTIVATQGSFDMAYPPLILGKSRRISN